MIEAGGVRAILRAVLWAVLAVGGVNTLTAQTDADSVRVITREKLETLLANYRPAREMKWQRGAKQPFNIAGFYDQGLRYASRLEIVIIITTQQTIDFRVYPQRNGAYININRVRDRGGLMQKLLRLSDQDFFHWGADAPRDVFAQFTLTLESGFPEEAIKVVIRSIPLIDPSVGELRSLID